MKKSLFYLLPILFIFIVKISYAQLVTPTYSVCPGQTVEYTIDSDYYGYQELYVLNGVFVVNDSLLCNSNDSLNICTTFNSSNNKISIKWANDKNYGTIRLKQFSSFIDQDFTIVIVDAPSIRDAETIVNVGTNTFEITVREWDAADVVLIDWYSSNITFITTNVDDSGYEFGGYLDWHYTYQLTEDQSGWVKFKCKSLSNSCSEESEVVTVNITRKLNPPAISGVSTICNSQESYSISADPQSESYTWTTSSGLSIYKNGQYLSTYTGIETSVSIAPLSSNLGKGDIEVVAHSGSFLDSEKGSKNVSYNGPAPEDTYLTLLTTSGDPVSSMCEDTHYHLFIYNTGPCTTTNYTWNIPSAWTVNYTYNNMISIYTNSIPGGMIEVYANTCCGTNSKILTDYMYGGYCGGYYMTISPNPADSYVELTFEEETKTIVKNNKIKVKKNKFGELGEYRVQIIDKKGNILKNIKNESLKCGINTNDIKPGIYFLHLITEDEVFKQQIVIK